jgi:hypothetical protein
MSQQNTQIPEDQLSPKLIIKRIIGVKEIYKKNKKIIIAFTLAGLLSGFLYDLFNKKIPEYYARIVFNIEAGAAESGISGIANMLGLGGGGASSNIFSGDNFIELCKTRSIQEKALLGNVTIKGKNYIFANYFLKYSGALENELEEDDSLKNFYFKHTNIEKFTKKELINLRTITDYVAGRYDISLVNRKASFQMLVFRSYNEQCSYHFTRLLLKTVIDFYTFSKTQKSQELYSIMKSRTDSLKAILYGTEARLSRQIDANQNIIMQEGRLEEQRLSRNTSQLSAMYLESMRQLDNIKLSLVREAPIITIIDSSKFPLERLVNTSSRMVFGLTILGLMLSFVFIFLRDAYREAMAE